MRVRLVAMAAMALIAAVTAVGAAGTGKAAKTVEKAAAKPAPVKRPLPDWAPKHPSREFLRASALIRPVSLESLKSPRLSGKAQEARLAHVTRLLTHGYELFGSLSDEQLRRYLTRLEVRIPVKAMTRTQRAAMQNWFRDHESNAALIDLYRNGAAKDLSNVELGFLEPRDQGSTVGGNPIRVRPTWWIKQRDGSVKVVWHSNVGWLYQTEPVAAKPSETRPRADLVEG